MLGKCLKEYRIQNNLSQKQMAQKIGTSQSYYCQIECDKRKPSFILIKKISRVLKVNQTYIRTLL